MRDTIAFVRGLTCEHVAYDAETYEWVFRFGPSTSLRVAAPWRIIAHGQIELGRDDNEQQFGLPEPVDGVAKALALLSGRIVDTFFVSPVSADAAVDFGAGVRLEIFNSSSGYEAWTLAEPGGLQMIAQGGGRLVEIPAP